MKSRRIVNKSHTIEIYKFIASNFYWQDNRPKWIQYMFELVNNIQLMSIIYIQTQQVLQLPLSGGVVHELLVNGAQIFGLSDLSFMQKDSSLSSLIFVMICLYFTLYLFLLLLLIRMYLKKTKPSKSFHLCLTYWTQGHQSLLFWLINTLLLSLFSQDPLKRIYISNISEINIGLIIGVTVLLVLNHLFAIFGASFCYDPFITSNPFASHNSTFQKLTLLYKVIIGPFIFLADSTDLKWIFIIISFVLTLVRYELILYDLPFYHFRTLKLLSIMASSSFSITLVALIIAILPSSIYLTTIDLIFAVVIIILFFAKLTKHRIHLIIRRNISRPLESLKTKQDIFRRIFALSYFADNSAFSLHYSSNKICNNALIYMIGEMSLSHPISCKNSDCICQHYFKEENQNTRILRLHDTNIKSLNNSHSCVLNHGTKSFRGGNIFKILYAFVLVNKYQNFVTAQSFIFDVYNDKNKSLNDESLLYVLNQEMEKQINRFMQDTETTGGMMLDAKLLVDIERDSEHLFQLVKQQTKSYSDLWSFYQQGKISLNDFILKSIKFEKSAEKIQKVWNKMTSRSQILPKAITSLYTTYLAVVRNTPYQAEKIFNKKEFKRRQQVNHIFDQMDVEEMSNIIVYLSMSKERLGTILHISKNISALGYSQKEAIGQNIAAVQPPFVRERHQQILINHKENSQGPFTTSFGLFAQNRKGYILPINGCVTIFPYVEKEPIYVGIVQAEEIVREVMIMRSDGLIDCFTEGIAKDLGLDPHVKIYIDQICEEFASLNQKDIGIQHYVKLVNKARKLTFRTVCSDNNPNLIKQKIYHAEIQRLTLLGDLFFCIFMSFYKVSERQPQPQKQLQKSITRKYSSRNLSFKTKGTEAKETPKNEPDNENDPDLQPVFQALFKDRKSKANKKVIYFQESLNKLEDITITYDSNLDSKGPTNDQNDENIQMVKNDLEAKNKIAAKASSRDGSVTTKKRRDVQGKIEEAIYMLPKPKYMKLLNYQMIFFTFLCFGLLSFQLTNNLQKLDSEMQMVDLIVNFQKETKFLISINKDTRMLSFLKQGIVSDKRHTTIGIESYTENIKSTLRNYFYSLDQLNDNIMGNINILDKSMQQKIYSYKINENRTSMSLGERKTNKFEIVAEIVNGLNLLILKNDSDLSKIDSTLDFILDNTMNDILLVNEQIIQDLSNEYESNLYEIKSQNLVLMLVAIFCSLPNMLTFFMRIKEFLNKRNQIIQLLQKLDENARKQHLRMTGTFYNYLMTDEFSAQTYLRMKSNFAKDIGSLEAKGNKKKSASKSKKGLNTQIIGGVAFTLLAMILFISAFLILALKFNSNLSDFIQKKANLVQINQIGIQFNVLRAFFFSYLNQPTATVRNNLVRDELNILYSEAATIPHKLNKLLETIDESEKPFVSTLLFGDFCTAYFYPDLSENTCITITGALGSKGLIGLISNYFRTLNDFKSLVEDSNYSRMSVVLALNSKEEILHEQISSFMQKSIALIEETLKNDLRQTVETYRVQFTDIIIIYVFVYLIVGCVLLLGVWKKINKTRDDWRKILRQIPFSIFSSDKLLKNYLVKDCDNFLDSYKNMM